MHFCKKSLDFLKFLVDIVTRIRRRREPPFQSLPCRTGRTARFDFATQNLRTRGEFSHLIRKPPPLRKTVDFPNPCDNFFKLPLQAGFVRSERCSWFDGCTFAKKSLDFLEIPRRYCHKFSILFCTILPCVRGQSYSV